jgi:hypothetical protein
MVALWWYALIPILGAFFIRRSWRQFRRRFDDLRLVPLLDYRLYTSANLERPSSFRFLGGFESVSDDRILWVRNEGLTVPVDLSGVRLYVLPSVENLEGSWDSEIQAPQRIQWKDIAALAEGAQVFIGGRLCERDGKRLFCNFPNEKLLVLFYEGSERTLTVRAIQAGRQANEYWNPLTPYALAVGIFSQLTLFITYLPRPAYRINALAALVAVFGPLFPLLPPALLFTAAYRRLWRRARLLRVYRDWVQLPLRQVDLQAAEGQLPDGQRYGWVALKELPPPEGGQRPPLILPERRPLGGWWYVFGSLPEKMDKKSPPRGGLPYPGEPRDPMAVYACFGGNPVELARAYNRRAHLLELGAVTIFSVGILSEVFFIATILYLLQ